MFFNKNSFCSIDFIIFFHFLCMTLQKYNNFLVSSPFSSFEAGNNGN